MRLGSIAACLVTAPLVGCSVVARGAVGPSIDTHGHAGVQGMIVFGGAAFDAQGVAPEALVEVGGGASYGPARRSMFAFPTLDFAAAPKEGEGLVLRAGPRLGVRAIFPEDTVGPTKAMFALGAAAGAAHRFGKRVPFLDVGVDARCFGTFGNAPYGGMICSLSPELTVIWEGAKFHIR